jgi:hypothetical protein
MSTDSCFRKIYACGVIRWLGQGLHSFKTMYRRPPVWTWDINKVARLDLPNAMTNWTTTNEMGDV